MSLESCILGCGRIEEDLGLVANRGGKCRHIDAAKIYGNQKAVGLGLKDGAEKAGLKREDYWVTSKLWNDQ